MLKKVFAVLLAALGLAVSACAGGTGGQGGGVVMLPPMGSDVEMFATLPTTGTIGEELPGEGLGSIDSARWKAELGGFTQQRFSQSLGFPPGTKITLRNLSRSVTHTLDVVKAIDGPPADFPKDPTLSIPAKGDGKLEAGYASGPIDPGKSVTLTLVKAGTYLIGCAFHYHEGMRDVLVVAKGAKPGPQASPPPRNTPTPHSRSSYDP
jgi:plastocyanin